MLDKLEGIAAYAYDRFFERATSQMVQRQQHSVGEPSEREHYSLYY